MSDTVDIGAARVRLIVDAADFQPVIDQGKNAIRAFGAEAQQVYDRTEKGTRRAADALLDYVSGLGRADTSMDKLIRNASRMGVEKPVLDAAIQAWAKHTDKVEQDVIAQNDQAEAVKRSQAAYKDLITTQQAAEAQAQRLANAEAATRIENLANARAAAAQQDINGLVAPGLSINPATQQHRLDAEEAFKGIVEAENAALAEQAALEARAAAQRTAGQSFLKQLQNTQQAAGKTYYELQRIKAAELGISAEAEPLIRKLQETNQALGNNTISAKQYEFALRGLPAQFTDVFVSLAAGQNPLTVLLQQGGQIKDMFGGIKTAVLAVGRELGKLATNPWILLAGVILSVGAAAYSTMQRLTNLQIAAAKGSGVAGNGQTLGELASNLDKLNNINLGNADAAVSSLAEAGILAGQNFKLAAEASARWANVTGESVDTVAGKFNEIARDPMAAVYDGTLKITDAQYAQLVALERLGDKQGAVALAVKLYYDQVNANSASVVETLSSFTKGWRSVLDAVKDVTHEVGTKLPDALDTVTSAMALPFHALAKFLNISQDQLPQTTRSGFGGVGTDAGAAGLPIAQSKPTVAQLEANKELQKSFDDLGTKQQIYAARLNLLQGNIRAATAAQREQLKITLDAQGVFGGPGYAKLVEGLRLQVFGQGPDPTKEIKAWEKAALEAVKATQEAVSVAYSDQQLSAEQYYMVAAQLARDDAQIELESIDKQVKALTGRANSEDAIAALKVQRSTVLSQLNATEIKLTHDSEVAIRARTAAYHDYVQALADANIALSVQGDQQARAVGIGDRQAALLNAQDNARRAEAAAERAAQDKADAAGGGSEAQKKADDEKAAAAAALSTQLDILQGNYNSLATAESSWLNGSVKAWQDWSAQVQNQAAEAGKVFNTVMNDISTDISDAATKGHLSFKNLLSDLLKEITEYGAKQALLLAASAAGIKGAGGAAGAGGGGGYGALLSGVLGLFGGGGATNTGTAASGLSGLASLFTGSFGGGFFAQGGVPGGAGVAAYRNSVVSAPTYFPFAKGGVPNVGLMGEKSGSPGEAIMPLTRTAGGDLGVKVTGQQQQAPANITQVFVVPDTRSRQSQDQLAIKQAGAARRATSRS